MAFQTDLARALLFLVAVIFSNCAEEITTNEDEQSERFGFFDLFNPSARIECISGFAEEGLCVPLRNCAVLRAQVRHLNPGRVFHYLQDYTFPCAIRGQVCCPERRRSEALTEKPWSNAEPVWTWPDSSRTTPTPQRKPQPQYTRPGGSVTPPKKTVNKVPSSAGDGPKTRHKNRGLLPEDSCGVDLGNRVLGGEETELEEHTWLALLRLRLPGGQTAFICGGSLISSRYVLTAAHCLKGIGIPSGSVLDMVRLGEHNTKTGKDCRPGVRCSSPPQDIEVEERIIHPDFTPQDAGTYNDIALLRLKKPVKFNLSVQPVCLPLDSLSVKKYDGKKLTTVGWGRTSNDAKYNSPTKQKVTVPVIPSSVCVPQYRSRKVSLRDTQMCAGGEAGKDSCQGDSGGPLLSQDTVGLELRWHIQGIVSTGPKECGKANNPAIYTRVAKYLNWILDNMRD